MRQILLNFCYDRMAQRVTLFNCHLYWYDQMHINVSDMARLWTVQPPSVFRLQGVMERLFFPLSSITSRISELLQPAITKRFWVKAEVVSGRERGGAFYCDLIETGANGKIAAKLSCTIWSQELTSIRNLFKSKGMDLVLTDGTVVGFQCSLQ